MIDGLDPVIDRLLAMSAVLFFTATALVLFLLAVRDSCKRHRL